MTRSSRSLGWGVSITFLALAGFLYAADENEPNKPGTNVNVQVGQHGANVNVQRGTDPARADLKSGNFVVRRLSKFYSENFYNDKGEKVGKLEDLAVDPQTGAIAFGVVSFDHSVGVGSKYFAIPWTAIHKDIDQKDYNKIAYSMPVDKNKLEQARGFDKNNWPDLADQRFSRDLYSLWGQQPYWEGSIAQAGRIAGTPIGPEGTREQAGMKGERVVVRGSDLAGHDLVDSADAKLGKLEDVMVEPKSGEFVYAITKITKSEDMSRNLYPVPWSLMSVRPVSDIRSGNMEEHKGSDQETAKREQNVDMNKGKVITKSGDFRVVLTANFDQLKNGPQFSSSDWPNMTPQWGEKVYDHYGVRPFWKGGEEGMHEHGGTQEKSEGEESK